MANRVAAAFARVKKGFRERRLKRRNTQQRQRPIPKRGQVKRRIAAKAMHAINKVTKAKMSPPPPGGKCCEDCRAKRKTTTANWAGSVSENRAI